MKQFSVDAPAKINLFLEVLDTRKDGYHNVLLVNQTIDLMDRLTFTEASGEADELTVQGLGAGELIRDIQNNTILKTLANLRDRFPKVPFFQIRLDKNIPIGAGLGGGSSDAGAVFRAVLEHCLPESSVSDNIDLASEIGSDVPFAVVGGTALVEGKGEKVRRLTFPFTEARYILASPPVNISTAWAYAELDRIKTRPVNSAALLLDSFEIGEFDLFAGSTWNSFESVTFTEYPELVDIIGLMETSGCSAAWMTGSGSNLVGLCSSQEHAEEVVSSVEWPCPVRICKPVLG